MDQRVLILPICVDLLVTQCGDVQEIDGKAELVLVRAGLQRGGVPERTLLKQFEWRVSGGARTLPWRQRTL